MGLTQIKGKQIQDGTGGVDLTQDVTNTLPIGNGGTGQITANAALNALLPSQTSQARKYLRSNGTDTTWGFSHANPSSVLVASNAASTEDKAIADYVCDGTADDVEILAAIAVAQTLGGSVLLSTGTFNTTATITLTGDGTSNGKTVSVIGQGNRNTVIVPSSGTHGFTITGAIQVNIWNIGFTLAGSSSGIVGTSNGSAPYWSFWLSSFKNLFFKGDFAAHSGWAMNIENPFRSTFENIEGQGIANGIYVKTATASPNYNPGNCTFIRCFIDLNTTAGNGVAYKIHTVDSATSGSIMNILTFIHCEAIDSASASTTSIGWYLLGNSLLYPATKDITIINSNVEQFNTCVKSTHAVENHIHLSYADTKTGGTIFDVSSDSNGEFMCDSGYVGPSKTTKFINDANTSTTHPTIAGGLAVYVDTGATLSVTKTSATILTKLNGTGPGTIATEFTTFDIPANKYLGNLPASNFNGGTGASSSTFLRGDMVWSTPAGGGDVSSNTALSVDSEIALFNSTTGKSIKRATGSGIAKLTSGVLSLLTAPTGALVGDTDAQTLSGKRITPRVNTEASSSTSTPTGDASDVWTITALAAADAIAAPTGTPTDMQKLIVRIKDNGTARALTFNAIYRAGDIALPTTTILSKTMYLLFLYNSADTKWDFLAYIGNF